MPEHIHLLVSEPEESSLSAALQILKQQVARILLKKPKKRVPGQLMLGFAGLEKERHLWQRRFYDFNVWSESKFNEKLNYMHANPVKRGLVMHPKDWPWSSWSHYAKGKDGVDCESTDWRRAVNGTGQARKVKTRTLDEPKAKSAPGRTVSGPLGWSTRQPN